MSGSRRGSLGAPTIQPVKRTSNIYAAATSARSNGKNATLNGTSARVQIHLPPRGFAVPARKIVVSPPSCRSSEAGRMMKKRTQQNQTK